MEDYSKMSVVGIQQKIRTLKGNLTRFINNNKLLVDSMRRSPSVYLGDELQANKEKMDAKYEELEKAYRWHISKEAETAEEYQVKLDAEEGRYTAAYTKIIELQAERAAKNAEVATTITPTRRPEVRKVLKARTELKPRELTHDAEPVEFNKWKKNFKTYFNSSNLSLGKIEEQRGYLDTCLSAKLIEKLDELCVPETPIFSEDEEEQTCFYHLNQLCMRQHPLVVRRTDLLGNSNRYTSEQGDFHDFAKAIITRMRAAELWDIAGDQLAMTICIAQTDNQELKSKLIDKDFETLDDFLKYAWNWDRQTNTKSGLAAASKSYNVMYVKSGQPGRGQWDNKNRRGGEKGAKPYKKKEEGSKRACFRCAAEDHVVTKCRTSPTTMCTKCNKVGHTQKACHLQRGVRSKAYRVEEKKDAQEESSEEESDVHTIRSVRTESTRTVSSDDDTPPVLL